MSVGSDVKVGVQSYTAFSKETTLGTYASATTAVECLVNTIKTDIKSLKLPTIGITRGFSKRVTLEKTVGGTIEGYLHPHESPLLFAVALGGGIVSTVTAGVATHSITAGNFLTTPASLSFDVRKGDTHTWRYTGGRINTLKITAKVNEPVKVSYDLIFIDSTQGTADISSILSVSSILPFVFTQGKYRYYSTEALVDTTTAEEPIQGFELTIKNNLETGSVARQMGSNILSVLPIKQREVTFMVDQRFDTTTTWNRFIQATQGAIELLFAGSAITVGTAFQCQIRLPKVFNNNGDTTLNGPNTILTTQIMYDVLVDNPSTTTGKDIGVTFINDISAY